MSTAGQSNEPRPYRRTLFDRFGLVVGDAMKALAWGGAVGVIGVLGAFMYASERGYSLRATILLALGTGLVSWLFAAWLAVKITAVGGSAFRLFIAPGGSYEYDYSFEDSLVARGDIGAALTEYEKRITAEPANVNVRLRAADLYARPDRSPARAAELLREVQRVPRVSQSNHLYATNRLIDLYEGPLNDTEKAMSELRQLIYRYPRSTEVGRYARAALLEIKHRAP